MSDFTIDVSVKDSNGTQVHTTTLLLSEKDVKRYTINFDRDEEFADEFFFPAGLSVYHALYSHIYGKSYTEDEEALVGKWLQISNILYNGNN